MIKQVNGSMSDQERDSIKQHLEQALQLMPFLIDLDSEDRQRGIKLGERSHSFAQKVMNHVMEDSRLLPGFINSNKLESDYQFWSNLYLVNMKLKQLNESVDDTLMAMGSQLFDDLLDVYHHVKLAKGRIPGIDTLHKDLQQRWLKKRGISIDEEGLGITDNDVDGNVSNNDPMGGSGDGQESPTDS